MKTFFVGIILAINSIVFAQGGSDNPLMNSRNYKTGIKTPEGKGINVVRKGVMKRNYKKASIEKNDSQEFNGLVESPEKSMQNRNYKRK